MFISNSERLDSDAKHIVEDIYYLNYTIFLDWAKRALDTIRTIHTTFVEEGDYEWRKIACTELRKNGITPLNYQKLISQKKLIDLCD